VRRPKPINADLPETPEEEPSKPEPAGDVDEGQPLLLSSPPSRRQPKPLTPKLLALLALLAVGLIVAAILGGTGGGGEDTTSTASPPVAASGGDSGTGSEDLGYPAFATSNTTRIGGSDAAEIAAAAALTAYPSTTAAQRPALVTLVAEEDWAGAIAAAVLMAEPVRAPLLVSGPGEVPGPTGEALAALAPTGEKRIAGASVVAVGAALAPGDLAAESIPAGNGAEEAAAIAALRDRAFGTPPRHVVIAPLSRPQLAMPAAAWAARSGDPVLFAEAGKLPKATERALRRYKDIPAYVLGPSSAISPGVLSRIGKLSGKVRRIAGKDPVANALAFARYGDASFGWDVNDPGHGFVLARDTEPLVAGAVAALSGSGTWGPLLLTDSPTKLPAELRDYFLDVKPGYTDNPTRAFYNHVWVVGDEEAIDVNQQAEVNELAELAKIGGGE